MPYRLDAALDLESDVTGVFTGGKIIKLVCSVFIAIVCREILQ